MRVLQITTMCGTGSVGRISVDLFKTLIKNGHDCLICYGRGTAPENVKTYKFNNKVDIYLHAAMTRINDKTGFYSTTATKRLIDAIQRYNPDVIHLHCLHGYYVNIELLFSFLEKSKIPIIWTMHDCWAFTGHCAYFDYVRCEKWKNGCSYCPQKDSYPASFYDNSRDNFQKKKELFTSVKNMTIVSPSVWLEKLLKQSFLKEYPVKVINNGIDLEKFKSVSSTFKKDNRLEDKFIILGVASVWEKRKGLNDFIKLSKILGTEYKIVVVGVTKKQKKNLPENILGITRTNNVEELVAIYSSANVFVNTTYEDNFPTTNIEAIACGTPVITYDTGGSPESIDESCGIVVETGMISRLVSSIEMIKNNAKQKYEFTTRTEIFNREARYNDYLNLYNEAIKNAKVN